MKVPVWTEITEEELRGRSADELAMIFKPDETTWFQDFCEQQDVSFELIKDIAIWGTFGPDENKHPLKWVFLKNCSSNHLHKIIEQRKTEDDYNGIIIAILYDRDEINTCDNCNLLRMKMKFDCKRYYCAPMGCRSYPKRYICGHWKKRSDEHSFEGTISDFQKE